MKGALEETTVLRGAFGTVRTAFDEPMTAAEMTKRPWVRRASYLVLFVAVVFIGDRLISFGAMKLVQQSKNQFVRMYEGKYPANFLFLGNSRVDRNFNFEKIREVTGKSCLNLGLGGNHTLIAEVLLKDFVERYGNPELVVVELSHSTANPYTMGEMGIFSYCSTNMQALGKIIDPTYAGFESIFHSLRFNNQAFWRLSSEVFSEPPTRLLNNTIPAEIINQWQHGEHVEMPIYQKNLEALTRICQYADARQIRLRLVIGPYWKEFRKGWSNYDAWKAALQKAAGKHEILDYSEVFFDHAEYFNDEMHLNATGAACFTRKLVEEKVL